MRPDGAGRVEKLSMYIKLSLERGEVVECGVADVFDLVCDLFLRG